MTEEASQHTYHIGDSVLVDVQGSQIPGVIEDERNGEFQVKLAQPWVDESGRQAQDAWVSPDRLSAYIEEETGGTEALPG